MDGMGEVRHMDAFRRDTGDLIRPMVQVSWWPKFQSQEKRVSMAQGGPLPVIEVGLLSQLPKAMYRG